MKKRGIVTIALVFGGLFLALLVFIVVLISAFRPDGLKFGKPSVGVVEISGPIMDSKRTLEEIKAFSDNAMIVGVVVRIDSPGGAVAPSQEIFEAVKRLSAKKPVAVSMGSTAASGGYYIAVGSDMIFANPGTVTGSIGVISQFFNVEELMDTVNVRVHTVKTGAFKDTGSPFREFSEADERFFNDLIDDIYLQFIEDIASGRKMEIEEVRKLADGRVFTGRQAKKLKMIDELGTIDDAVAYVAGKGGLSGEPSVVYPAKQQKGLLSELLFSGMSAAMEQVQAKTTPSVQFLYVGP